jgi:DNA polymerase elongation subunit (family B)
LRNVGNDDFRKRLDALNREPLPQKSGADVDVEGIRRRIRRMREEAPRPPAAPVLYRRDIPRSEPKPTALRAPAGPPVILEEAVKGAEVSAPHGGRAYVIVNRLGEGGETRLPLHGTFPDGFLCDRPGLQRRIGIINADESVAPEDVVLLDLETTGLATTPLFLIGTLIWEEGTPVVQQYFARDYAEERAVISLFVEAISRKKLLVSFNGRTFDLPYIRVRSAASGIPFHVNLAHLDMLHECRRAWRTMLPDCKLQTLERHICGRMRHRDIPGSEIPEAYHAFVRTGNAAQIVQILEHNMLDLVTLAELMVRLPAV